jgi:hypothetical protein
MPTALLALGLTLLTASGQGLRTVERTIQSYAYGKRTYTCLALDGGVVPLFVPADAKLTASGNLKITWPADQAAAVIRPATAEESALLDGASQPNGRELWQKALLAYLHDPGFEYSVGEFQPAAPPINHWRIAEMTLIYSLGGVKAGRMLLVWRTQDDTTLVLTMQSGFNTFQNHCDALHSMINGAMILKNEP